MKKIIKKISISVLSIFLITNLCSFNIFAENSENSKILSDSICSYNTDIKTKNLFNGITITEFYSVLNNLSSKSYSYSELKDIIANIHRNVEIYVDSIDKNNKTNQEYMIKISDAVDNLDEQYNKLNNLNYRNSSVTTKSLSWRFGDILYYGTMQNNANGEKSLTGHTAVLSTSARYVIEAATTGSNGAKVFHWHVVNLWSNTTGVKQYRVASWLGNDASVSKRTKAVNYGLKQIGEPYSLKTTLSNEDKWYCSKLTYRMWKEGGYSLQPLSNYTNIGGYLLILPVDIVNDSNTWLYKRWGSELPTYA